MEWGEERYVKLYTRDTATWALWGWEARCVLCLLLRKVDGAGVLEHAKHVAPEKAVAVVTGLPSRIAAVGLGELVGCGTAEIRDGAIVLPKFVDGQNAPRSPKDRMARYRERLGSKNANSIVTTSDAPLRSVTAGDESYPQLSSAQLSSAQVHDHPPEEQTPVDHDDRPTKRAARRRSASPDGSAGGVAEMRRKRAKDAWTWHEEQRASRLHRGDRAEIREPTREDLDRIIRLHAHIRKRHGLDEEMGWKWVWAFRESRLAATEIALREASPEAPKLVGYARGDAAWSRKAFDIFGTARPKEPRTTAQDREAFERAVEARKREATSGPA